MTSHEREAALLPVELFRDRDVFFSEGGSSNNNINHATVVSPKGLIPYESISVSCWTSYSSWSDLNSPFGSELESTSESTESEDEEFISELTRRMAESMLQDDDEEIQDLDNSLSNCLPEIPEGNELSVNCSEYKSDNSVCHYYKSPEFIDLSESPSSDYPILKKTINKGMCSDDHSTDEQMRPVQVYQLKNQPQVRKQSGYGGGRRGNNKAVNDQTEHQIMHNRNRRGGGAGKALKYGHGKKNNAPPLLPTPQAGSGMRAVFLKGSESSGCPGTGVFLPSGAYKSPEPKRKPGCSTVLIPARVLQTLQQHFNTVGATSPSNPRPKPRASPNLPWQNDVLARINGLLSQQKEHAGFQTRPASSAAAETNHHPEVQLPQEWTY